MTPQSHTVQIVVVWFECSSTHEESRSSTQAFQSTEQEFTDISEKSQCGEKTKPFATENFRSWCHSFRLSPIHFAVPLKLDDQVRVSEEFTESEELTESPMLGKQWPRCISLHLNCSTLSQRHERKRATAEAAVAAAAEAAASGRPQKKVQ